MAQFVAGKAARDGVYLAHLAVTSLPLIVLATAVVSILFALAWARVLRHVAPVRFLTWALLVSSLSWVGAWVMLPHLPVVTAIFIYLQVSVIGPLLGSGLWLIATERFDPRAARTVFGRMLTSGTIGGLLGGLVAARVAAFAGTRAVLLLLASIGLVAVFQVAWLGRSARTTHDDTDLPTELAPAAPQSSLLALSRAPFLRDLALLVWLGTMSSALLDYLFKAQVVSSRAGGDTLVEFFAWYYAATSVLVYAVQAGAHRAALERFGLAGTIAAPAVAVVAGGVASLAAPGLASISVARGAEAIMRGSLFRAAYEIFFTPVASVDKRAAKSIIDVAVDRLADAAGAVVIVLVLTLAVPRLDVLLIGLAIASSSVALVVARRLTRGYVSALERSLRAQAVALPLSDVHDRTTRTVVWHTQGPAVDTPAAGNRQEPLDVELLQMRALRSGDAARVRRVLDGRSQLPPPLIAHVIPLLDAPEVAADAARALTRVTQVHAGELIDAMLDARRSPGVRRRLARVLGESPSPRVIEGLLHGLAQDDFALRVQCGRSLSAAHRVAPAFAVDSERIFHLVKQELSRGRDVWEGLRALEMADTADEDGFVDDYVRRRAHQGLAHVFTLLSLILPSEPLRIAYRALHTDDRALRGTALEYLDTVLPADVRATLWPHLEEGSGASPAPLPRGEVLARLVQSHPSILINLRGPGHPEDERGGHR